jgi:hypothetical protein
MYHAIAVRKRMMVRRKGIRKPSVVEVVAQMMSAIISRQATTRHKIFGHRPEDV